MANVVVHNETEQANTLADKLPDGKVFAYGKYNESATLRALLRAFGRGFSDTENYMAYLANVTQLPDKIPNELLFTFTGQNFTIYAGVNNANDPSVIQWGDTNTETVDTLTTELFTNKIDYVYKSSGTYNAKIVSPENLGNLAISYETVNFDDFKSAWSKLKNIKYIYLAFTTSTNSDISGLTFHSDIITVFLVSNGFTGDISGWEFNNNLEVLALSDEGIEGNIASWTFPSTMKDIRLTYTGLTGDLSGWALPTSLTRINLTDSSFSGDISGWTIPTELRDLVIIRTSLSGDVSNLTLGGSLVLIELHGNNFDYGTGGMLTGINVNMSSINLASNAWTSTEVDQALVDMDSAGLSGTATISIGGTNAAPSSTGLTAKANLESRGYTVNVTT